MFRPIFGSNTTLLSHAGCDSQTAPVEERYEKNAALLFVPVRRKNGFIFVFTELWSCQSLKENQCSHITLRSVQRIGAPSARCCYGVLACTTCKCSVIRFKCAFYSCTSEPPAVLLGPAHAYTIEQIRIRGGARLATRCAAVETQVLHFGLSLFPSFMPEL